MELVKNKFHLLDIKGQIHYGILTVSLCVCFLIFSMLFIYSFVIINLSYIDVLGIIDEMESKGLEAVSLYYDTHLTVNAEISKLGLQWMNNLITNLDKYQDRMIFSDTLINEHFITDPVQYNKINQGSGNLNNTQCFYYSMYNKSSDYSSINNFAQILFHTIPYLDNALKYRLISNNNLANFDNISIFAKKINASFIYPYNNNNSNSIINKVLNYSQFQSSTNNLMNEYISKLQDIMNTQNSANYLNKINNVFTNNKTLDQIIQTSPAVLIIGNTITNTSTNANANAKSKSLTVSYKLDQIYNNPFSGNNLSQINSTELSNDLIEKVDYYITGDWNSLSIEEIEKETYSKFPEVKAIYTEKKSGQESLLFHSVCNYFRKLYLLNNPNVSPTMIQNLTTTYIISDCFNLPIAKNAVNYLINIPEWVTNNYKRKLKYPLVNFYGDTASETEDYLKGINYKVFKYHYPDRFGLEAVNPSFLLFNNYNIYLFKVTRYTEIQFRLVFYKFLAIMFSIILLNVIIWGFILFIISLLVKQVSISITTPIQALINYVTNIGLITESNFNNNLNCEKIKNLDDITYNDDKDINEMFIICKDLIRGGFNNKQKEELQKDKLNCINNVSHIKTNNLQIDENFIDKDYIQHVKNVFNFTPQNVIMKKDVKDEDFLIFEQDYDSDVSIEEATVLISSQKNQIDFEYKSKNSISKNLSHKISNNNKSELSLDIKKKENNMKSFKRKQTLNLIENIQAYSLKSTHYTENEYSLYIETASKYSTRYSKFNLLYNTFHNLNLRIENPYPIKYYNNNVNYKI